MIFRLGQNATHRRIFADLQPYISKKLLLWTWHKIYRSPDLLAQFKKEFMNDYRLLTGGKRQEREEV
jgi:hypothetical protein